jgi:pilus assembly protein CpaC
MLTSFFNIQGQFGSVSKQWLSAIVLAASMPATGFAQQIPTSQYAPNQVIRDQQVIPVQAEFERQRPIDDRIISMPDVNDHMEVIHHRSQLLVTSKRIKRMAIADPSVIELAPYSEKEISVIGLEIGATTLTIWFEDDSDPLIILVKTIVDPDLEDQRRVDYGKLERKLSLLFPNSKVHLIPMSYKIIVKGQARDSEEAARILNIVRGEVITRDGSIYGPNGANNGGGGGGGYNNAGFDLNNLSGAGLGNSSFIVNMLQVPGEFQVMLKVRIAELNRSQLRRFGVNLNFLLDNGRHAVGTAMGGGGSTFTGVFENGEAAILIDALAANGTATVLAEPTLTVLSGHTASFLSGGEFAVPTVVGIGGAQGQTTTFRGFGTSLLVSPSVIDGDLIRMQIVPEFSGISSGNAVNGVPGLNTRRVQTTVELREGQTILLGGLLLRERNTEVARIPWLGSLPVVGNVLFNAKRSTEDETELMVLVSPEIVRPMDPEEVPPVPGFNSTHPADCELYKYGRTEGPPDNNVYQLAPYGNGVGRGEPVGFNLYNPAPATPQYAPIPTANQPGAGGNQLPPPGMGYPQQGMGYPQQSMGYPQPGMGYQPPQQQMSAPRNDANVGYNKPAPANYRSGPQVAPVSQSRAIPPAQQPNMQMQLRSRTGR